MDSHIYLLYKAEKPSVCLSIRLHFLVVWISAMTAQIDIGLARRDTVQLKCNIASTRETRASDT